MEIDLERAPGDSWRLWFDMVLVEAERGSRILISCCFASVEVEDGDGVGSKEAESVE